MRIVISGASSGIGEALARHYDAPGNVLGFFSRRIPQGKFVAQTAPYSVDVTDVPAVERAARDFIAKFGAPDLVIANSGIGVGTRGDELADIEKLRRILDVHVSGMAATLAAFAPAMREARHGTLVGVASVAGFRGLPGSGAYSASKAAAITWLESLRVELHGSGVSVVCICPGYIDTPMTKPNRYRMPFLMRPDEFARRMARAVAAKRKLAVIPWQMAAVSALMRAMPNWLYDRLGARAPRKPRDIKL